MQHIMDDTTHKKSAQYLRIGRELIELIILVVLITTAIRITIETRSITQQSMEPNYEQGELVVINKLAYTFGFPQRGDVIVFHYPLDPEQPFIKRIIGIPGDTVTIDAKTISVNDHILTEPYIRQTVNKASGVCQLGKDDYFVMGDNRPVSVDSRSWGVLNRKYFIGKVSFVYWPANSIRGINTYSDTFKDILSHQPPDKSHLVSNPAAPAGNCTF
jgi:signal peptidase I